MKRSNTCISVTLMSVVLALGCGGSQPPPEAAPAPPAPAAAPSAPTPAESAPAAPSASAAPSAEPAEPSWKDMSVEQKKEVMKTLVLPQMKTVFAELDAKDFADMNCTTCHGQGAKAGKFDMPNPKLPKLDPAGGFAKHLKAKPKVTKFMMERVAPEMAKLLKIPPNDPKTNEGFGCFNCHTKAGK